MAKIYNNSMLEVPFTSQFFSSTDLRISDDGYGIVFPFSNSCKRTINISSILDHHNLSDNIMVKHTEGRIAEGNKDELTYTKIPTISVEFNDTTNDIFESALFHYVSDKQVKAGIVSLFHCIQDNILPNLPTQVLVFESNLKEEVFDDTPFYWKPHEDFNISGKIEIKPTFNPLTEELPNIKNLLNRTPDYIALLELEQVILKSNILSINKNKLKYMDLNNCKFTYNVWRILEVFFSNSSMSKWSSKVCHQFFSRIFFLTNIKKIKEDTFSQISEVVKNNIKFNVLLNIHENHTSNEVYLNDILKLFINDYPLFYINASYSEEELTDLIKYIKLDLQCYVQESKVIPFNLILNYRILHSIYLSIKEEKDNKLFLDIIKECINLSNAILPLLEDKDATTKKNFKEITDKLKKLIT